MEFIESTATDSYGSNCTISEARGDRTGGRNRNGQDGGKATTHGGRGDGVGGRGVKRKWSQEEVDSCIHLTEQRYSSESYEKFYPVERQLVWQNKNDCPKYAAPQTSNHMAVTQATVLSKISSKFSALTKQKDSLSCRM